MKEIELVHVGGERKTLEVVAIEQHTITVRWGMSGLYEIDLKTNTMKARSLRARRRADCHWRVVNIEEVRAYVRAQFVKDEKMYLAKAYERHTHTMPKNRVNNE